MPELDGRVALVTGASRGIGRAIAVELAAAGAAVGVNFRADADAAAEVVAEITGAGGRAAHCRPTSRTPMPRASSSEPARRRSAIWTCSSAMPV